MFSHKVSLTGSHSVSLTGKHEALPWGDLSGPAVSEAAIERPMERLLSKQLKPVDLPVLLVGGCCKRKGSAIPCAE